MLLNQFKSRLFHHIIALDTPVTVVHWKIAEGKSKEQLKATPLQFEYLTDEGDYTRAQQEKSFKDSIKGYGQIMSRTETTATAISKEVC